ncbi:unnamed protein product [Mytilus coruscus]|uniref:EF-hand domain-containing protein n=1 Tax=Mytilus coruscus TaxID=42192 RepID=A0A6J8ETN9_MYTCO|nr:unnamed protein product [Mytilus coruscus]
MLTKERRTTEELLDLKLSCLIVVLASCASLTIAQKRITITGDVTKNKDSTRVDLGISHKRKNFEIGGSFFGDNRGNRGARNGEHFEVRVIVNHCDFNVYDINEDSVITVDEIYELFPQRTDAHRLFKALDSTSVDGKVTIDEFNMMALQVIKKCGYNKPNKFSNGSLTFNVFIVLTSAAPERLKTELLPCSISVLCKSNNRSKKKTTITGDLIKNKDIGTSVDLGISHQRGKWGFDGSGFGTSRGHRGGSLGISHIRKNFEFGGSVFGDNRGNRVDGKVTIDEFKKMAPQVKKKCGYNKYT